MTMQEEMQSTFAAMGAMMRGERVPGGSLAGKAVRQPEAPRPAS